MTCVSPRISVIVPAYNAEPFLAATLDSVLAQTIPPHEVIVIDDGSNDRTASVAGAYSPSVQLIQQPNAGVCLTRNRAFERATGDWIALLDADDVWHPSKLERQIAVLRAAPEAVCCYTDYYAFDEQGRQDLPPRLPIPDGSDYRVELLCEAIVAPSGALVRADLARAVGFRPELKQCDDMIFFLELRQRGPFVKVSQPLFGYRRHSAQYTAGYRHEFQGVMTRFRWFEQNAADYTPEQQIAVRERLSYQLFWPHAQSILAGDRATESDIRRAYRTVAVPDRPIPRAMRDHWLCQLETRWKRWLWFRCIEPIPGLAAAYHATRGRPNRSVN